MSVDISALIDVVFLLLIFFMVTTTFTEQQAVDVELPSAEGEPRRTDRELPELVMRRDGSLLLEGQPVDVKDLPDALRDRFAGRPAEERQVVLRGDKDASYGVSLEVMDALRKAGAAATVAITEPGAEPGAEPSSRPAEGGRGEREGAGDGGPAQGAGDGGQTP